MDIDEKLPEPPKTITKQPYSRDQRHLSRPENTFSQNPKIRKTATKKLFGYSENRNINQYMTPVTGKSTAPQQPYTISVEQSPHNLNVPTSEIKFKFRDGTIQNTEGTFEKFGENLQH